MRSIGSIAMILLFGVGFTMYLGGMPVGFMEFISLIEEGASIQSLVNTVLAELSDVVTAGTIVIAGVAAFANSASARVALGVAILVGLISIFMTPFTFYNEASSMFPQQLALLVRGFFNLLIILAVVTFVSDKEW